MTPERTTQILAIDLGKFRSVACEYNSATSEHNFTTISTTPAAMHELFGQKRAEKGHKRSQDELFESWHGRIGLVRAVVSTPTSRPD